MTSDYLTIKSLFYNDKSILEGMEALRSVDEKLQRSVTEDIWKSYVYNAHGNQQQISLELSENPELIKEITDYHKGLLLETFEPKIRQMNTHTKLKSENRSDKTAESLFEDGTIEYTLAELDINSAVNEITHLAVIDRVLNSDGNDEKKTDLRNVVLGFLPKMVQYTTGSKGVEPRMRYDSYGRNAQLYIINMICQGEDFPTFYIDKILTTSGKTELFDTSTAWNGRSYGQQNPLHVAWLLSTWKQQSVIERTILLPDEIDQEDAVEKFRTMVLQSHSHYLDKGKFEQEKHSSILRNLTIIERFLDPDFEVDFSTDVGLSNVHDLAKAIKELLDTYSKDDVICNFLKTIRGPQDPRTFEQRTLPDGDTDIQNRILEALKSNPTGLSSDELREQADISRVRLSEASKSYIDKVDDRYTLKEEFLPPFKGLSVYIHEELKDKCFVDHIVEHIETIEPSTSNFNLYIEILKDFDLFLEPGEPGWQNSEYLVEISRKNFLALFSKFTDYLTKANDLPDVQQKLERIKTFKQIIWEENQFGIRFINRDKYHEKMVNWTQHCIEINLDKKLANIDFSTYQKLMKRRVDEWGEPSFKIYSSNYLSKVARLLLDQ